MDGKKLLNATGLEELKMNNITSAGMGERHLLLNPFMYRVYYDDISIVLMVEREF
jgi:hypothetical protein